MAYELIATTDYIRGREVFLIHVDLSDYLLEYYTHRQTYAPDTSPETDDKLKTLISCFAIHMAARTTFENHAWTLQMVSDPPYSLFVTGSTGEIDEQGITRGFLVGHVLDDSIRHSTINGMYAQCSSKGGSTKSYVQCENSQIVDMAETFYRQSEQRELRVRMSPDSDTAVGLVALSGYDPEWFRAVDLQSLTWVSQEESTRMKDCRFTFSCDCSPEKLKPFFRALTTAELDDIYGADSELIISCPRCGKQFAISRSDLDPLPN